MRPDCAWLTHLLQEYLTNDERAAAEALGWTDSLWSDGAPPTPVVAWLDMSPAQMAHAHALGYDSTSWDSWSDQDPSVSGSDETSDSDTSSTSESDAGVDEFGRCLDDGIEYREQVRKPLKLCIKAAEQAQNNSEAPAAGWWAGDGVWETQVGEESDEAPFRYEFTTADDGIVHIVRLDGDERVPEGTASHDGAAIDAEVFGGQYSAQLDADGASLLWSDGDEWVRVSTRRKAAARRRRRLTKTAATPRDGREASAPAPAAPPAEPIVVSSPPATFTFPKAATPSFSFSPAPAADVMPATSCQPTFSFPKQPAVATPSFSFPAIPATPAGTPAASPPSDESALREELQKSEERDGKQAAQDEQHEEQAEEQATQEEAQADEQSVVPDTNAQQHKVIVAFYAKFDSSKGEAACQAILDKRKGDSAAMSTLQFSKLCGTLQKKYGTNPMDLELEIRSSSAVRPVPEAAGSSTGWATVKSKQADCSVSGWNCSVCMVSNGSAVKVCAACEAPKPGCELNSEKIDEDVPNKKAEEMQATMHKSANDVAAAGISFGLASSTPVVLAGQTVKSSPTTADQQATAKLSDMDQESVQRWLSSLRLCSDGLQVASSACAKHNVTGAQLAEATMESLKQTYGIKSFGVRFKLLSAQNRPKGEQSDGAIVSAECAATTSPAPSRGEQTLGVQSGKSAGVVGPRAALSAISNTVRQGRRG